MDKLNVWFEKSEWRGFPYIFPVKFDNHDEQQYWGTIKSWMLNFPFFSIGINIEPDYND